MCKGLEEEKWGVFMKFQVCVLCLSEVKSCRLDKLGEEGIKDGKKIGNYFREL